MEALFREALLALPPAPLRDLLRAGACSLCAMRFLSVRGRVYSQSVPAPPTILAEIGNGDGLESDRSSASCCTVCQGILQSAGVGLAVLEAIQKEGHEFCDFSLEVTVPSATLVRERSLWCYLRKEHPEDFKAEDPNECIVSLKEAVKWTFGPQIEAALGKVMDKNSNFHISLVFKHANSSSEIQFLSDLSGGDSKRKRGPVEAGESIAAVQRSLASISSDAFARHYPCPPPQSDTPCELVSSCRKDAIFVVGRYLKYSRSISQSPWTIQEDRIGDGSVQEIIGDVIFPHFKADSYKFHAAGREDIDVRMLGSGRPFLLEILNARTCSKQEELLKLEHAINSNKDGWVKVKGLKEAGNEVWTVMRQGEADKQKEYTAVVWLSRPVTEADFTTLSNSKELEIQQKTPVRVLHRRSPLVRPRIIHWMRCEALHDSSCYFLLHLCTQAGTYVKEFVHGDLGRTYPNVGSLLDCDAEILCLDVTNVKMDFL
ncbi:putative tRNA pseudouridine synthase Pus10 isoform X1 [Selaginella moellendorffii]|uniref:putative tRNA pseudouridine synthase Pus10 isoform X1 n=1 Tax=Selaginella moellendorffii TaxID=88036 RepID=UPI000D1CC987|nr:putative tRNA pseudouridine synthase Pus10 isoform X1 [Selaginella moellendorffii]|eukprot:XP_024534694.1 putative tRNA pseudouridine synthase Pus10 isoform X1 [Selaginella moellendorffii]